MEETFLINQFEANHNLRTLEKLLRVKEKTTQLVA